MRCRRYLHAVFRAAACVLFSFGSLILQGCGDAPPESPPAPKATPNPSLQIEQQLAEIYAGFDAAYPDGEPKPLSPEERHKADDAYVGLLHTMAADRDTLARALAEATAEKEHFAALLIASQNERLEAAELPPLNPTLEKKLLEDSVPYQTLVEKEAAARVALEEHVRAIRAEILRRSNAPLEAYKEKLSEADAAARAAGLPTRAEWKAKTVAPAQ